MNNFEIRENGAVFATISAKNATSALRKAANAYPRKACDYNREPGDEPITVTWYVSDVSDRELHASAEISVPGVGIAGCKF